MDPPFETARALSELYILQCGQWAPIWNSQIIGRYKEIPVHRENMKIPMADKNCDQVNLMVNESSLETVN